ncbi:hypothetical protein ALC56_05704 [Trachymyrmex septentrionalis]|uniref:Uncharacterized protein n=1 Tax=Trachymyrmex septentrionalis TaxID=34720 RepID=A0A195FHU9_9HYME|nr:hypothetical protein ALC56_05704 [Trachymyrmex septentrionalis]
MVNVHERVAALNGRVACRRLARELSSDTRLCTHSGADEGTPFPSVPTRASSGHHSLRLERKEGKTCGGIACSPRALRVRKTLGGFGDDRRCVVGGGGGASRPLQRLCIAFSLSLSLCIGWRV